MAKKSNIVVELRAAIRRAEKQGMTRYQIAKEARIALPVLIRIADGGTIPRLDTAEKIASSVGGTLTIVTK